VLNVLRPMIGNSTPSALTTTQNYSFAKPMMFHKSKELSESVSAVQSEVFVWKQVGKTNGVFTDRSLLLNVKG
jgi:hypothetical protein